MWTAFQTAWWRGWLAEPPCGLDSVDAGNGARSRDHEFQSDGGGESWLLHDELAVKWLCIYFKMVNIVTVWWRKRRQEKGMFESKVERVGWTEAGEILGSC